VRDEPIEINGWAPENFGGEYNGRVSLAEAFARSLNAAMVNLAQEVGLENVVAAARELGIDAPLNETPALALGASEVSLLDLTGAYASVRAGLAPIEPWGIVSFHSEGQPQAFRVGPPKPPEIDLRGVQRDLVGLMQLVVERGTGRAAGLEGFAAGKTGTSQNFRDAWFIGFNEPLVAGVWVGNDDDSPMNEVTGGKLPAAIWKNFMSAALAEAAKERPAAEAMTASAEAREETPVSCNVRACSRAYRSFRAEDCTFQPYSGQRRLCEK
jgi:membrane peptidoglycan carboxypeptidase